MHEKYLTALKEAKMSHLDWVRHAKMLTEGIAFNKDAIPVKQDECSFGHWFYDNLQKFSALPALQTVLAEIEQVHNALHQEYHAIYIIYFPVQKKKNFFQKLLGEEDEPISDVLQQEAKVHLVELERLSTKLVKLLDTMMLKFRLLEDKELNKVILG